MKEDIKNLIYNATKKELEIYIKHCNNPFDLHLIIYNYNYGDGFDIPNMILEKKYCSLSTALQTFYLCDGYQYLSNKDSLANDEWSKFIHKLYLDILNRKFNLTNINFEVPLSKIQIFKLKKNLNESEQIFITNIEGKNCNIEL